MTLTPSKMSALGSRAPEFALPEPATGKTLSLAAIAENKPLLVMFICNHCPFVMHINEGMASMAREFIAKGIAMVAINSNDVANYPDDSPERMAEVSKRLDYPFPYLYDEDQQVARAYEATCTPDFFLYDRNLTLIYRGQMDGSRPGNEIPVTGKDLRSAMDAILNGTKPGSAQRPSAGCNIKWKPGMEPSP